MSSSSFGFGKLSSLETPILDDDEDENDEDGAKESARVPGRVFSLRDMGVRVVYSERFRKSWGSVDFDGIV